MKNKTILITGATSGIGYATAIAFSKLGANLILCGRREEKLKKLPKKSKFLIQLFNSMLEIK